ncbi:ParA family protein [Halocatena marina]|uniref:ParA family protein n=1 Tax=Halocatena marina TaxID=2934937 RepID=UPI00200D9CAC|nr:ParA family protein [Halocatena marina]
MSENIEPRAVNCAILKGGVGKSTISVNVTERLAARGHDVLFVDLEPNGHASVGLGFGEQYKDEDSDDIGDVLLDDGDASPQDVICETDFGFDILPSTKRLETIEKLVESSNFADVRLRNHVVDPLLGTDYDFILTDPPAYRGKITNNAHVATQNLIVPLTSGGGSVEGFQRMMERQVTPLRKQIGLDILAIVPNRINARIDHHNNDRKLVERLNRDFADKLPEFSRVDFEAVDNGVFNGDLPKPGIRKDDKISKAYSERKPLAAYDPENDQLKRFDELADIVENGGVAQ